ncbi:hypothetical protein [Shimia sp. MIT910701]|uniref:hypothetical protein n=1 Tax=Shimia sp. MIT910701 TaxID=3096987 RepID=UPI00399A2802
MGVYDDIWNFATGFFWRSKLQCWLMNYRKCGTLASLLMFFGGCVLAEDRQDSLFERLERPATIIAHNAPNSFGKSLDVLNQKELVFVPPTEGQEPLKADVWVVFVENESEVASLQEIFQELYRALPEMNEKSTSGYLEFQLSSGEPKAASFHFVDRYATENERVISCKAAVAVYLGVVGNTSSLDSQSLTQYCLEQM